MDYIRLAKVENGFKLKVHYKYNESHDYTPESEEYVAGSFEELSIILKEILE